ncbi:methyltransferase-like protein 2 isoform X2 [Eurytemora carolleeae]|nr:methyltransferase-like protein 2 isoform X2 [Eurytemora carolleeae]|eukprot:XP_023338790.1 methyltransferase-like protein 2 isoform X2 [Eurytemora affinis]
MTREEGKRPQFGGRVLGEGEDVFKHNAWDNVEWDEGQEEAAAAAIKEAADIRVSEDAAEGYEKKADEYWDTFYGIHQNRFFKDRNWLFTEFPDLAPKYRGAPVRVYTKNTKDPDLALAEESAENKEENSDEVEGNKCDAELDILDRSKVEELRTGEEWFGENSHYRVLEVGCGTGSTVYPILEVNTEPGLMVYCCDLSKTAVNLVKEHKEFSQKRCFSFVCDVTKDWSEAPFKPESLDIVTLIFVLSAIHPEKMRNIANQIFKYMKPGGQVFFRDYGRYDMAQLRFKKGRCIQ